VAAVQRYSGTAVRTVADALDSGKVIGVDPTARMIELARKKTVERNVEIEFHQSGVSYCQLRIT
jgi:ubiquinone/menaquinone biosynthesis C-methylase UbiE